MQLRFSSDLLLEIGAGIELTTAAFPQFFLPMACVANVVKVCSHQHQYFQIGLHFNSIGKEHPFCFMQHVECRCCYVNFNSHSNL